MTPLSLAHVKTKEDMNFIVLFVDYMEMTAAFKNECCQKSKIFEK